MSALLKGPSSVSNDKNGLEVGVSTPGKIDGPMTKAAQKSA